MDGITAIVVGVRHRSAESHWGWHVVQGVISVVAGVVAFAWPGVTALAILFVIAFWSIVSGVAVLSVVFGIVLLVQPGAGLLTLLWLVGTFSVVFGIIVVVWAFRLRSAVRT